MTCAMPRPAMNRTSVAMIGWMRKRVISQPLNQPKAPASDDRDHHRHGDRDMDFADLDDLAEEDDRRDARRRSPSASRPKDRCRRWR